VSSGERKPLLGAFDDCNSPRPVVQCCAAMHLLSGRTGHWAAKTPYRRSLDPHRKSGWIICEGTCTWRRSTSTVVAWA
jgi:hypothetical protein